MRRFLLLTCLFVVFNQVDDNENVTVTPLNDELIEFLDTEETSMEGMTPVKTSRTDTRDYIQRVLNRYLAESRKKPKTDKVVPLTEVAMKVLRRIAPWLPVIGFIAVAIFAILIFLCCKRRRNANAQPPVNERPPVSPDRKDQFKPGQFRTRDTEAGFEMQHLLDRHELVDEEEADDAVEERENGQEPESANVEAPRVEAQEPVNQNSPEPTAGLVADKPAHRYPLRSGFKDVGIQQTTPEDFVCVVPCPNNPSDVFNKVDDDTPFIFFDYKPKEQRLRMNSFITEPEMPNGALLPTWLSLFVYFCLPSLVIAFAIVRVQQINRNPQPHEAPMPPGQRNRRLPPAAA